MLISRRTMLLATLAATAAACTTRTQLGKSGSPVELVGPGPYSSSDLEELSQLAGEVEGIPNSVMVVGDSISAGSRQVLDTVLTDMGFDEVHIDAEPSRRIQVGKSKPTNGLAIVEFVQGAQPPGIWVVELGTNDAGLYAEQDEYAELIDSVLDVIGDRVDLVWVNIYRFDVVDACRSFNTALVERLSARGNATIVDWFSQCLDHAGDLLSDGVHPNAAGQLVLADMIRQAIQTRVR
ncbi:MAG TPA: GDSL-type esterase/lipase family protein [Ilumatobacteraceae bacterium]|nr:GDSL-type esterase/lipase family protein [Ilumatobacteraceae bacterium]